MKKTIKNFWSIMDQNFLFDDVGPCWADDFIYSLSMPDKKVYPKKGYFFVHNSWTNWNPSFVIEVRGATKKRLLKKKIKNLAQHGLDSRVAIGYQGCTSNPKNKKETSFKG
jgi:hypothetical protein